MNPRMRGPATDVIVVLAHGPTPLHAGSPPPTAVAALITRGLAAGRGVTGMTNDAEVVMPAGTVHVTACPTLLHPEGSVPIVKEAGMVSVMTLFAVVVPPLVLLSFSV